jgi:uncharacterized membrane protein YcaP (DUF421 family)
MWFIEWSRLGVLVVIGVAAYAWLIVVLRVSGKRTLSKLNAFDFVVTVAFGSTLATVVLSRETPLAEGLAALTLLAVLQFAISFASRWRPVGDAVRSAPRAVVIGGQIDEHALAAERMTRGELLQVARQHGHGSFTEIDLMVLETDGSVSVVADRGDASALSDVKGFDGARPATERTRRR